MNEKEKQMLIEHKIEALAIHLNLAIDDIVQDKEDYDDEFMVRFHKSHKHQLECVTSYVAISNALSFDPDDNWYQDELTISVYTKLIGENDFYFRWL